MNQEAQSLSFTPQKKSVENDNELGGLLLSLSKTTKDDKELGF